MKFLNDHDDLVDAVDIFKRKKFSLDAIGFEDFIDKVTKLKNDVTYPPYNVIKIDKENLCIVMAVAGFNDNNLDIELEGNQLKIFGQKPDEPDNITYIYRGIANRSFKKSFLIVDGMIVQGAKFKDGLLSILLYKPVPENNTIKIPIKTMGTIDDEKILK